MLNSTVYNLLDKEVKEFIMNNNIWVGDKVWLRAVEAKDADSFFKWAKDYDTESDRLCDVIHFPGSYQKTKDHVEALSKAKPENDNFRWIIADQKGKALGTINTFSCDKKNGTFRYGLGIERKYWGKGYAKEAIKIILTYYFLELGYQKVNVCIYAFNERSLMLHEKLGFKEEGVLRKMIYTDGKHHDEIVMGLTKEEFERLDYKQNEKQHKRQKGFRQPEADIRVAVQLLDIA